MVRNPQSIDGFVLRRRDTLSGRSERRVFLDGSSEKTPTQPTTKRSAKQHQA
jgi:hypothetical protein